MSLHTVVRVIRFLLLYVVVFMLLAQFSGYAALVMAVLATKWVMKNL